MSKRTTYIDGGHVRIEILNPDGKPLNRKLLIYSDSVQGTVKAAIPLYRT